MNLNSEPTTPAPFHDTAHMSTALVRASVESGQANLFSCSMMKSMLFNAKMKFLSAADMEGVHQSDMCSGRIGLLNLLVVANCAFVPSLQQLTKMDAVRWGDASLRVAVVTV